MAKTDKQMREERAALVIQMEDLNKRADGRAFNDDEKIQWDKIEADIQSLEGQMARDARVKQRLADLANSGNEAPADKGAEKREDGGIKYAPVFDKLLRHGMSGLTSDERSFVASQKRGTTPQGTATGAAGGYLVAQEFGDQLIRSMKYYGGVLEDANIITTSTGAAMPFPTLDDTSNKGYQIAENAKVDVNNLTLGQVSLGSYLYSSGMVLLSLNLLQDDAVNIQGMLSGIFAERLGRIANEVMTTGDGANKPTGFLATAPIGVTTAATNGLTREDVIDLVHSVDRAYRFNGKFHMNDLTMAAIRKLSIGSADGRPLWQPSMREGEPDRIEGFAYTVNNDMPELGADAKAVAFGDFKKLTVRMVKGFTLVPFEEKYMDFMQKGFMAFNRWDCRVLDTKAIKVLQNAAAA